MNNKVHPFQENLQKVTLTDKGTIEPNSIAVVPLNQEPQEPEAFLLHHSNTLFIDILKRHLNKEKIIVQQEININENNLNYQDAMKTLKYYFASYSPKPGDIFGIEANLGSPGNEVPTCFPAIDRILEKNPEAIIFVFTNTPECIRATLEKYQSQKVYYIGAQTFDTTDKIVAGRTFLNANKFFEFYKKLKVPGSPTASSTSNNSGPVLSIASSPKSQPENSTPVGCSNKQNFSSRLASCFPWNSDRNKSDGNKNKSSTPTMEDSFTYVAEEHHVAAKNHKKEKSTHKVNNRK